MSTALLLGLLFAAIGASGVLVGAGLVLRLLKLRPLIVPVLLAFAAGTLLGASLLGLIPEAAEALPIQTVTGTALGAIVTFFLLEKWVIWRHSHDASRLPQAGAGYLILVGDSVHNVVDGLVIGAAFVTDPVLGLTVGVAILAHEIPQEVGDFAILMESGLSARRALLYNLLSACTIFPGVVLGYLLVESVGQAAGVALSFAAGGFLYIALADLVPDLQRRPTREVITNQLLPLLLGIATIWLLDQLER